MRRPHLAFASLLLAPLLAVPFACGGTGSGNAGAGGSSGGHPSGSGESSSSGPIVCQGLQERCGSKCVDLTSDTANCGACGNACGAGALCCASACVETASCSFSVSSFKPTSGWQNGGDYLTLTGQGFTAGMKVFIGDGRAAVRVVDANTARIKTPPGKVGLTDLSIQLGTNKATIKGGFQYQSAGLTTPWQQKPMQVVRGEDPGIAVMQDARVLVAGGTEVPDSTVMALPTAEIYTRMTDTVAPAANSMSTKRWHDSAVTLLDGRVLVVGGACYADLTNCNGSDPTVADLFDPTTDTFTPSKSKLTIGRAYTRAVLLPDGRVLIASANTSTLEVYDPDLDTFTAVPGINPMAHVWGFMVMLRDGRALLGGGDASNTTAEVFDPDTNTFTSVGPMVQGRSMVTAHTLPDGRVIVIGGASSSAGGIKDPLDSMEAFDPATGMFTALPYKLSIGRCWHASALVRDGSILVMGGYTVSGQCGSLASSVDQVDPVAGMVSVFATLPNANTEWTAVTLLDGSVLGVGGGACGASMALPDIDFLPGAPTPH
jgi:hypothetical protein